MDAKRLTKVTAGCTVAMLVPTILLGWWAIDWAQGVAKWSEAADEFPTVDELRGPAIPDAENAALVYQQAWEALDLTEEQEELLRASEDPEVLAPILDANAEALKLLHEAAQMEKCRFEPVPDPEGGPFPHQPHLVKLRNLGKLLLVPTVTRAAEHDIPAALAPIEDEVAMTEHLLRDPYGVSQYILARALLIQSRRKLQHVLAAGGPSARDAAKLKSGLDALEPGPALEFVLRAATAHGLHVLDHYEAHPSDELLEADVPVGSDNPLVGGFFALNRAALAREMDHFRELSERPWREVADEVEELCRKSHGPLFTTLLLPISTVAANRDEMLAIREMMVLALDISAFAAENGRLPESLDELPQSDEPDYALDPFSGARLRYEPGEDRAFKLWSVGRDLDDDGGVARGDKPDLSRDEIDLVFRVAPTP